MDGAKLKPYRHVNSACRAARVIFRKTPGMCSPLSFSDGLSKTMRRRGRAEGALKHISRSEYPFGNAPHPFRGVDLRGPAQLASRLSAIGNEDSLIPWPRGGKAVLHRPSE